MGVRVPPSARKKNPLKEQAPKRVFDLKTLNLTTLDTIVDKIENSEALIKIKLKEDDYQPRVTQKIKDFSKKANIKGFRPGKVPPGIIKQMYGNSFLLEEVNHIVSDELNKVLKENNLQFLGEPLPDDSQNQIDWSNQKEFEFVFNIGYAEEFDLKIDKKVKVDYHKIKIDNKILQETIENVQRQYGEPSNPESVGEGDTIYGPIVSADASINQEVSLDLREFRDSTAKKIIGMKLDDDIELDVNKSFTDKSYFGRVSRLTAEDLKKVKGKIKLTIKGINHVEPAKIDQDLFDKAFGKDAVKSETEFNEKVRETIDKNYSAETDRFFNYKIRETLVEKAGIKLPDEFLKKWLMKTNENMTEELLDTEYEHYVKELKWSLIRNKISKEYEIKVDHQEVVDEAKKLIIQQFGGPAVIEQLGDQLDTFADNYLKAEKGDNYMKVYNEVQNQKVYDYLKGIITSKVKEVSLDDFRKLT